MIITVFVNTMKTESRPNILYDCTTESAERGKHGDRKRKQD